MSKGSMIDQFKVGQSVVFMYGGGKKGDHKKGHEQIGQILKLIASGNHGQAKIRGHEELGVLYRKLNCIRALKTPSTP